MRHLANLVVGILALSAVGAAPIRNRPTDEPPLVGQTLTIELNADGELVLPSGASRDLKTFLAGQVDRIKKVAAKDKADFEPVLQVKVRPDLPYRKVVEILDASKQAGFEKINLDSIKKR